VISNSYLSRERQPLTNLLITYCSKVKNQNYRVIGNNQKVNLISRVINMISQKTNKIKIALKMK
jgi:hypothetical protein